MDRGVMALSLAAVVARCREETGKFLRREAYDERFCWELLRRAICDRLDEAWAAVFEQYRHLVLGWLRHHPARAGAGESDELWLNRVFERFWRSIGPEEFLAFPHLAALLRYLQTCVHGVLVDAARAQQTRLRAASNERAQPVLREDGPGSIVARLSGEALWAVIEAEAHAGAELLVARCCFVQDLKPREIYERHPEVFASVADVHRIKRNLLERLRRNETIRAFLEEQ